jgi:site-specific DNA-methyltransferase (adenine-specific)
MKVVELDGGALIEGDCTSPDVREEVLRRTGLLPLTIADPPYGNIVNKAWDKVTTSDESYADWMFSWTRFFASMCLPNAALYVWGGVGKPGFRPFYHYLAKVERETPFQLANHITWGKKRAYGVQHNYLFCREELAYLTLGDLKKPRKFEVPLLDVKRGYAGYNSEYPAKSEYLRRTNVWTDINELFKGKVHENQKPERLSEVLIQVHTAQGEWVFEPFAGSGSTARAARALGRRFVAVEKGAEEFEICLSRLRTNA